MDKEIKLKDGSKDLEAGIITKNTMTVKILMVHFMSGAPLFLDKKGRSKTREGSTPRKSSIKGPFRAKRKKLKSIRKSKRNTKKLL